MSELAGYVHQWLNYLATHGRSENTVRCWHTMVFGDMADNGWTVHADITFESMTTFLGERRRERQWSASTYKTHLAAWKSLDRYIKAVRDGDLQAALGPTDDEAGDGERAATLDEARRHLAAAWEGMQMNGQARAPRVITDALLFGAGLRRDECYEWTWGDVRLDDPHPYVAWRPQMQKNKRRMDVVLVPEIAGLLLAYREVMRANAKVSPTVPHRNPYTGVMEEVCIDPDVPTAPMFHLRSSRDTFRIDRANAGIAERDGRGKRYAPRSARKFFKTTLAELGMEKDWSEFFMRHKNLAQRYFDASNRLEVQAEKLSTFPAMLPAPAQALADWCFMKKRKKLTKRAQILSHSGAGVCDSSDAKMTTTHANPCEPPRPVLRSSSQLNAHGGGALLGLEAEMPCAPALASESGRYPPASTDAQDVAGLLRHAANLIERAESNRTRNRGGA